MFLQLFLFSSCIKKKGDDTVTAAMQKSETPNPWVSEAESKPAAPLQQRGFALTPWSQSSCAPRQRGPVSELETCTYTALSFSWEELSNFQVSSYSSAQYILRVLNSSHILYRVSSKAYFTFRENKHHNFQCCHSGFHLYTPATERVKLWVFIYCYA